MAKVARSYQDKYRYRRIDLSCLGGASSQSAHWRLNDSGGLTMKHFQICFLDRLDVPILMRAFLGADDLSALAEAQRLSATHTIEVWEGHRKVARVKKGNSAPTPADRLGA
jgi:hypothetical protein